MDDDVSAAGQQAAGRHPMPLLARLFLTFAGYVVAVVAATFVTVVIMLAPMALPDGGAQGSIFATLGQVMPAAIVVGLYWTFMCAWPGFIVAIMIGERSRWTGFHIYAIAGFANVVPSLLIYSGFAGSPFQMPSMVFASFIGGLAGGAAYWWTTGRIIAARRAAAFTAPAPTGS